MMFPLAASRFSAIALALLLTTPGVQAQTSGESSGKATSAKGRSATSTSAAKPSAPNRSARPMTPPSPRSYITNIPTGKKLIALTYDDGPDPRITPKLIELLQEKKVPATFYVLGERVKEYPEITRRLHELGFEVVNHTYSHKLLTKLSEAEVHTQLRDTNDLITAITGTPVTHMRPPYGGRNARVDAVCRELGMKIILWDVDTEDWRKRSTAQMTNTIMNKAGDGSIILFHDRYQTSLDTTAAVIDALRAKGYTFVTVGELLAQQQRRETPAAPAAATSESVTTFSAVPASE